MLSSTSGKPVSSDGAVSSNANFKLDYSKLDEVWWHGIRREIGKYDHKTFQSYCQRPSNHSTVSKKNKRNKPNYIDIPPEMPFTSQTKNNNPIVLIIRPCSMSSAVSQFLRKILESHGEDVCYGDTELTNRRKNPMVHAATQSLHRRNMHHTDDHVRAVSLYKLHHLFLRYNKRLVIKTLPGHIRDLTLVSLRQMNATFIHTYRENVLDRAVCMIRDCFDNGENGYPVSANNLEQSDMCFNRRVNDTKVMAHVFPTKIPDMLKTYEKVIDMDKRELPYLIGDDPSKVRPTEELFDYEYTSDEETFQKSLDMWSLILRDVLHLDSTVLEKVMRNDQNRFDPTTHNNVIDNVDELDVALKTSQPPLDSYIRK